MGAAGSDPAAYEVRTPRLLLRPLRAADRAEFTRVRTASRAHLAPWKPLGPEGETPDEHFERELLRGRTLLAQRTGVRLVAELLTERPGAIAGGFNLNNIIGGAFQNSDAGWWLAADCTGRGLATEAVTAMLDLAFAPPPIGMGLHRVQANIIPDNAPSLAVAARCGFRREGLAKAMLQIAGEWRDHVMHAKLAEEHEPVYLR